MCYWKRDNDHSSMSNGCFGNTGRGHVIWRSVFIVFVYEIRSFLANWLLVQHCRPNMTISNNPQLFRPVSDQLLRTSLPGFSPGHNPLRLSHPEVLLTRWVTRMIRNLSCSRTGSVTASDALLMTTVDLVGMTRASVDQSEMFYFGLRIVGLHF